MRQKYLPFICMCIMLAALALSTGCAKKTVSPPVPYKEKPAVAEPAGPTPLQPPSKWQKPKTYTINGRSYTTMSSAAGFVEEGYASWYGKDFHGRKTANGEVYDMYGMTAAHKLLPFNTPVRVTNLETGKSTVLRVNDRGPFIKDRIIDLTYTAAQEIGMAETGTARVRVEALNTPSDTAIAEATLQEEPQQPKSFSMVSQAVAAEPRPVAKPEAFLPEGRYFVQIGAFGKQSNAEGLKDRMTHQGKPCRVVFDDSRNLWRVQVGPYSKVEGAEQAKDELASINDRSFVFAD
ncbi:septal ring lytic transglycosylase RlpA family protein [Desulfovibrio mangrovi]|uniref:septal ring lytic transglycosylase RlpA family protein n=1 Tax=Desulfovibrio mangrovi TaxID=2976983 RepID=UPI00224809ED|nr:septal ring lytic transglycosylase RlpA family protein [Desulfovibrio mangrovi]UZP66206.1 septal ring lytic transglycosylase RlpA family protein [Desulfovibrio mangrovi]